MRLLILSSLLGFSFILNAQTNKCGYDWLQEQWFNNNPKDYNQNRQAHINRITRF